MSARLGDWDDLVAAVPDGASVGIGGVGMSRKPMRALMELVRAGRRDLDLVTFVGGLDVELLLAAGALRSVTSASVALGPLGRAPRFTGAVAEEAVEDREMSEWMLVGGLRAAAMGVPFLPTRAAIGSDLATARGLRRVVDPYSGESYLAVPPLRPDVAIVQAWRADAAGNVQVPWPPDHLWDVRPRARAGGARRDRVRRGGRPLRDHRPRGRPDQALLLRDGPRRGRPAGLLAHGLRPRARRGRAVAPSARLRPRRGAPRRVPPACRPLGHR